MQAASTGKTWQEYGTDGNTGTQWRDENMQTGKEWGENTSVDNQGVIN